MLPPLSDSLPEPMAAYERAVCTYLNNKDDEVFHWVEAWFALLRGTPPGALETKY
jgi:hypothetical protein